VAEAETIQLKEQFITFKIGSERYGIGLKEAKEIILPPEIKNVPNTSESIIGVINLRGKVVPVLNFKIILNTDLNGGAELESEKRIIIININNITAAFMVDKMMGVVDLNPDNFKAGRENGKKEFLKGVNAEDDKLISIIDLKSIIESRKVQKV